MSEIKWIDRIEKNSNTYHGQHPALILFFLIQISRKYGRSKDEQLECLIKEIRPDRDYGNE